MEQQDNMNKRELENLIKENLKDKALRIYELDNLEDNYLLERKKENVIRRKLSGNNSGGRPKISPLKESLVLRLRNEGFSYRSIRTQTGISLSTIRRIILDGGAI